MGTRAFTVGNERSYDQALSSPSPVHKLGVRPEWDPPYEGGWVWRTAEEALAFLAENPVPWPPGVYELVLPSGWDEDVLPEPDSQDGVHRLRNDSLIIRKVQGAASSS